MTIDFKNFFYSFLEESWQKRLEQKDFRAILQKYEQVPDVMFSFRDYLSNKSLNVNPGIGINPKSRYNTPNGIYGYPLKETLEKVKNNALEFASDRPIMVVYKPKNNVPVTRNSSFTEDDLTEKIKMLQKLTLLTEEQLRNIIETQIYDGYKKTPLQTLWSLTRYLTGANKNKWAKMLVDINLPIIIDDLGTGLIHKAEPIQCVVFGRSYVDVISNNEKLIKISSLQKLESGINALNKLYKILSNIRYFRKDLFNLAEKEKERKMRYYLSTKTKILEYLNPMDFRTFDKVISFYITVAADKIPSKLYVNDKDIIEPNMKDMDEHQFSDFMCTIGNMFNRISDKSIVNLFFAPLIIKMVNKVPQNMLPHFIMRAMTHDCTVIEKIPEIKIIFEEAIRGPEGQAELEKIMDGNSRFSYMENEKLLELIVKYKKEITKEEYRKNIFNMVKNMYHHAQKNVLPSLYERIAKEFPQWRTDPDLNKLTMFVDGLFVHFSNDHALKSFKVLFSNYNKSFFEEGISQLQKYSNFQYYLGDTAYEKFASKPESAFLFLKNKFPELQEVKEKIEEHLLQHFSPEELDRILMKGFINLVSRSAKDIDMIMFLNKGFKEKDYDIQNIIKDFLNEKYTVEYFREIFGERSDDIFGEIFGERSDDILGNLKRIIMHEDLKEKEPFKTIWDKLKLDDIQLAEYDFSDEDPF
jgi:hypothetical protein